MTEDDTRGLWVRSDVGPMGNYQLVVTYEADRSWVIHHPVAYAADVLHVVAMAEHDAAILGSMRQVSGVSDNDTALVLTEVCRNRPAELCVLTGMSLSPVCAPDGSAVVTITVEGHEPTQASAEAMRQHAVAALMVGTVTDLDQRLYEVLRDQFDLGDTARAVVASLAEHWPQPVIDQ